MDPLSCWANTVRHSLCTHAERSLLPAGEKDRMRGEAGVWATLWRNTLTLALSLQGRGET